MQMFKVFGFFIVLSVLSAGCDKDNKSICNYDPCALVAPTGEVNDLEDYLDSENITGLVKHCSGFYYEIITPGSGFAPGVCNTVYVKYTGKLTNGNTFDSNQNGTAFQLSGLIDGWKKAIPMLKPGGKIKLYLPPTLGYGSEEIREQYTNNLLIPANSILIFDIELIAVY